MRYHTLRVALLCIGLCLAGYLSIFGWRRNRLQGWKQFLGPSPGTSNITQPVAIPQDEDLRDEITVVTAFFKLKPFKKGKNLVTSETYHSWMVVLGRIYNPMVIYVDDNETYLIFQELRQQLPANMTKLILVNRADLWSFGLVNEIRTIYKQPVYPKHEPNTVIAEYSCAMHAKFELVGRSIQDNSFRTKYFSWLDIGYFRDEVDENELFELQLPPSFEENYIAYNQIYPFNPSSTPWDVIKDNVVWVCGGMFLGRHDVVLRYTDEYKIAVLKMIHAKMMSTDQQVIYSMFLPSSRTHLETRFQLYTSRRQDWFLLGYLCKHNLGRHN